MAGIDLDGSGDIDMYPEETGAAITAAGRADTALNTALSASLGRIAGLDQQVGTGPLGRPVAAQYNPAMAAVVARVAQIHEFAAALVAAGQQAVRDYVEGDAAGASAMRLPELAPAAPPAVAAGPEGENPGTFAPHATPGGR